MKRIIALSIIVMLMLLPAYIYADGPDDGRTCGHSKSHGRRSAALQGNWALYGTDLQDEHIWIGYITIDRRGDVIGGEMRNPYWPPDRPCDIGGGHFDLDRKTGKVTGFFYEAEDSAGDEVDTTEVEATMNYSRDQISGVNINTNGHEEGIFILVKMPIFSCKGKGR